MAIKKKIQLDNGIITNYHRIVSLNKIINNSNIIEVASYTSEEKRKEENSGNAFIHTTYLQIPYNENMTVSEAYDYIKTLENFKNSKDI
jgi:hypothetical protein